jgi:hypothetical protein
MFCASHFQQAGTCAQRGRRVSPPRQRVEHHRSASAGQRPEPAPPAQDQSSGIVRTLTTQLADLKRRHREETAALRQALEQAHGENLVLRRRLASRAPETGEPS